MTIRILRIIARLNIGGPAIHTVLLNHGLARRGYKGLLVTGEIEAGEGDMGYLTARHKVDVELIPELSREIRPGRDVVSLIKILRIIRRFRPHIVHTHTAKAGLLGRLAATLSFVPVRVHTFHGHVFHGYFGPAKTTLFLNLERALATFTNRLVAISGLQKSELAHRYRVAPPHKFEVIPLGFGHLQELADGRRAFRATARNELDIDPNSVVVGIVGRLVPVKNHATFLKVAAELKRKTSNVTFLVVGDGPLSGDLKAMANQLGIADCVRFLGWRRDLVPLYAAMDLCCLTSLNEGTPVTVIEALAAGVPVVATSVGGVPDVLENGRWGRMADPADPSALARAALEELENPRSGTEAQAAVLRKYSSERLLDDVEALYIRLLDEAGVKAGKA